MATPTTNHAEHIPYRCQCGSEFSLAMYWDWTHFAMRFILYDEKGQALTKCPHCGNVFLIYRTLQS